MQQPVLDTVGLVLAINIFFCGTPRLANYGHALHVARSVQCCLSGTVSSLFGTQHCGGMEDHLLW